MARIRTIKPEFWTDDAVTECSLSARLLFIGCLNFADDAGNLERSSKQLKAKIFPHDTIDCEPLIQELISNDLFLEYEVEQKKYIHIKNFSKHQKIDKPSKSRLPSPDDGEIITEKSDSTPRIIPDYSSMEKEKEKEKEGKRKYIPPIPAELLNDYLQVRKAKKVGPLTATAFNAIEREAKKAGISVEDAITICISRGWIGFKAEWIASKNGEFKTAFQRRQENNAKAFEEFLTGGVVEKEVKDVGF